MAINKINSKSIEDLQVSADDLANGSVTGAKLSYPLTTFSSTGIDDNATSTAITIDSSDNVGIGTSSPNARLETKNPSDGSTFAFQATNDNDHEIVQIGAQSDGDGYLTVHGQGAGTNIKVQLHSDGDSYFTGGNVGIGTSSPQEKLDINGNIAISGNTLFEEVVSSAGMPSSAGNKSVNTNYDSTFSLTAGKWLILVNASLQAFQTSSNESGLYLLSLSLGSSAGADDYGLIQKAVLKWGNGSNSYGDNCGGHFPTLTLGSTTTLHTRWRVDEYGTASNFWVRGNLTRIRCIRIG